MSEDSWLSLESPGAMLDVLCSGDRARHWRKVQLFCCALLWRHLGRPDALVLAALDYADGLSTVARLHEVWRGVIPSETGRYAGDRCPPQHPFGWAESLLRTTQPTGSLRRIRAWNDLARRLLLDVVGSPVLGITPAPVRERDTCPRRYLRHAGGLCSCPDWLTSQAVLLARSAYQTGCDLATGAMDPTTLLATADALEEGGCPAHAGGPSGSPSPLLDHLRDPEPHVRGCWAVDWLANG